MKCNQIMGEILLIPTQVGQVHAASQRTEGRVKMKEYLYYAVCFYLRVSHSLRMHLDDKGSRKHHIIQMTISWNCRCWLKEPHFHESTGGWMWPLRLSSGSGPRIVGSEQSGPTNFNHMSRPWLNLSHKWRWSKQWYCLALSWRIWPQHSKEADLRKWLRQEEWTWWLKL